MMTKSQGEALATFVARIRDDWDHPGILASIGKAQHLGSPVQVARALLALAENRELRTPAILSYPGSHWADESGAVTPPKKRHTMLCPEHPGKEVPCDRCREGTRPPTPEELAAMRQTTKEAAEYHREMQRLQEQRKAAKS